MESTRKRGVEVHERIEALGRVLDAPASVFHGLTQEKVEIINGAFHGRRVRLATSRDFLYGSVPSAVAARREVYVFLNMIMPGRWSRDPLSAVWDLRLQKTAGILRIVSPSIVIRFELLEEPELLQCEDCLAFRRREELRDFGLGFNPDFREQSHLISRLCCRDGTC